MNPFKRIATRLNVSLETFLDQVENHEASAECAIREIRKAAAKARTRAGRVRQETEHMSRRMAELDEERAKWTERARKVHGTDEARALECARRVQAAERESEQLKAHHRQNAELEIQLDRDLQRIEHELQRLRMKRNQLASREANAEALRTIENTDSLQEVNHIFERWETKIAGYEDGGGSGVRDCLAAEFDREEENEELKAKLDTILRKEP